MIYEPPYENDGRVLGLVKKHFLDREYGFLTDVNGQDYFFLPDDAILGTPLGHVCFLSQGIEVDFQPVPDSRRPGLWKAEDIRMVNPPEIAEIEESTITSWHRVFGWGRRSCSLGCKVFVVQSEVLSDLPSLAYGDHLRHETILSSHRGKASWAACNIDVYLPDSQNANSQEAANE